MKVFLNIYNLGLLIVQVGREGVREGERGGRGGESSESIALVGMRQVGTSGRETVGEVRKTKPHWFVVREIVLRVIWR